MIKISDSFKTDNKKLAALYSGARSTLLGAIKPFGDYSATVTSSESDRVTLKSELMSAETVARYNMNAALDCVKIFLNTQRADGRFASSIVKNQDGFFADYSGLAGLCFAEEALSIFYMSKKKELGFAEKLYDALERFDEYLWATHDKNFNGCLEAVDKNEISDSSAAKYIAAEKEGESPFPVELAVVTALAYRVKLTLSKISEILVNGKAELYSAEASALLEKISVHFWNFEKCAFVDRDRKGRFFKTMTVDNLLVLYYGAASNDTAQAVMKRHLLDPEEFYTNMPFPQIVVGDPAFDLKVRADDYRRALRAFEKYGFYSELTELSGRFLSALSESLVFTEFYDCNSGEAYGAKLCADYAPAASAVLEMIARSWGVSIEFDNIYGGALGHEENDSEYSLTWGGDTYKVLAEKDTTTGLFNDELVFTVTNGVRVITDWFGNSPKVVNITKETIDCVFVYRDKTFSFTIEPGKIKSFKDMV